MTTFVTQRFYRIQISCPCLNAAADEVQTLFSVDPCWQGVDDQGRELLWFKLSNTIIELLEDSALSKSRITALVLAVEREVQGVVRNYNAEAYSFCETALTLSKSATRGLAISLVSMAETQSFGDVSLPEHLDSVDHLVLRSDNADDCIGIFSDDLGIRLALDKTVPEWGGRMVFFRAGQLTLELIESAKPLTADYFWGLALRSKNIHEFNDWCQTQNIELSSIRPGRKPSTQVATLKSHNMSVPTLIIQQEEK